ncbi:MAG: translocation/assembly module TamB, partial [Bacteroidetes bacterium]|nr:translocation/assembly module TamB [Bacteroidota bacterium]
EGRMDMTMNIGELYLKSLKPFTKGLLQDIDGALKGNLAVSGTLNAPQLNGYVYFDSTKITPLVSGEPLKLSNDKIEFDKDGFNFSKFTILDSANNKAVIDGNVYTSDFRKYKFDLSLNANNFRLVNAVQSSNKLFYGKLNIDVAANVSGDMESPKVEGNIRVNKRTDFTVILPSNDPELISREGVVRFVDKDHPIDTVLINQTLIDSLSRESAIKGIDIAANIETDSNAIFTMIIDERSGDALSVRGRSDLSFGMDKSGKMSLTGNYEVESGTYNLSLDVLKRKFDIQRGSTITWTGDPTSAQINLTATYSANTASIDLVEQELAGRTQTEINKFKQKLPFLVKLKMEGELLKPQISFDISLADNVLSQWPDVDTKLQQVRADQSELNKQVFALLLLNRFVGENPLQSSGDALNAGQMAWQSASQILSNQLNAFAGSLIKGVDINFDLNNTQDYSTGEQQNRTDLNVTVSKKLFNDRIRVNVGSNFELQGPANPNENATNIAGDIAIDYQLTKDGRYMVRAYRKNQYELVVEGQVIETGISFILTLDYNKFKEIFERSRRKKTSTKKTTKATVQNPTQK